MDLGERAHSVLASRRDNATGFSFLPWPAAIKLRFGDEWRPRPAGAAPSLPPAAPHRAN